MILIVHFLMLNFFLPAQNFFDQMLQHFASVLHTHPLLAASLISGHGVACNTRSRLYTHRTIIIITFLLLDLILVFFSGSVHHPLLQIQFWPLILKDFASIPTVFMKQIGYHA